MMTNLKPLRSVFLKAAALGAGVALLTGCVPQQPTIEDAFHEPANASEAYPITVAKGPITLDVSSRGGTLQASQANAVMAFANRAMTAGVTPITIRRPSGGGNSARVANEIANLMSQSGVPRDRLRFGTYSAPALAPVKLSFISTFAKTKRCGVWRQDVTDYDTNGVMPNMGCAVRANIAAMVADPETFVVPAPEAPTSASGAAAALGASSSSGGASASSGGGSGSGTGGSGNP